MTLLPDTGRAPALAPAACAWSRLASDSPPNPTLPIRRKSRRPIQPRESWMLSIMCSVERDAFLVSIIVCACAASIKRDLATLKLTALQPRSGYDLSRHVPHKIGGKVCCDGCTNSPAQKNDRKDEPHQAIEPQHPDPAKPRDLIKTAEQHDECRCMSRGESNHAKHHSHAQARTAFRQQADQDAQQEQTTENFLADRAGRAG